MVNDKKNTNELASDDNDSTAELEQLLIEQVATALDVDDLSESAADTHGLVEPENPDRNVAITELKAALKDRSETIDQLQYDIEQLRSKWTGLETEIRAREDLTDKLNDELRDTSKKLDRKEKLLSKHDQTIKSLQAEVRDRIDECNKRQATVIERDQQIEQLQEDLLADRGEEAARNRQQLERQAGQIADAERTVLDLQLQIRRTESYADILRQKLQDKAADISEADDTREVLRLNLSGATEKLAEVTADVRDEKALNEALTQELDGLKDAHEENVRVIRSELGETQEMVAQHELVTEQLASDLVDTRGFRIELEKMLNQSEEENQSRIDQLEKDNRRLLRETEDYQRKLETKSEAINGLLEELAKKSQQIESIGEIEDVIQDIDTRMSERIDESSSKERERVTRVLIGSIDGQELRFPLFKDRLTIGRTEQNDIQLDATFVSRRHAVIVTNRDETRVIDWGSKNGVFVNSKRITEHFLKNGDTVTIGTADFRYEERPKRDS